MSHWSGEAVYPLNDDDLDCKNLAVRIYNMYELALMFADWTDVVVERAKHSVANNPSPDRSKSTNPMKRDAKKKNNVPGCVQVDRQRTLEFLLATQKVACRLKHPSYIAYALSLLPGIDFTPLVDFVTKRMKKVLRLVLQLQYADVNSQMSIILSRFQQELNAFTHRRLLSHEERFLVAHETYVGDQTLPKTSTTSPAVVKEDSLVLKADREVKDVFCEFLNITGVLEDEIEQSKAMAEGMEEIRLQRLEMAEEKKVAVSKAMIAARGLLIAAFRDKDYFYVRKADNAVGNMNGFKALLKSNTDPSVLPFITTALEAWIRFYDQNQECRKALESLYIKHLEAVKTERYMEIFDMIKFDTVSIPVEPRNDIRTFRFPHQRPMHPKPVGYDRALRHEYE